jgi:hypothetical protein
LFVLGYLVGALVEGGTLVKVSAPVVAGAFVSRL